MKSGKQWNTPHNLPVFMQDETTNMIIGETIASIPKGSKVYLVGGAVRNALYFKLFGRSLTQRDYDLAFIGNMERFVQGVSGTERSGGRMRS